MAETIHEKIKSPNQTFNPIDILNAESEHLKLHEQKSTAGLAISGGGIRSASFGLGVMQALVNNNQLSKMDYMSTVSGGGYLGSALTWALKQGGKNAGTSPDNFPLGKLGKHGQKGTVLENKLKDKEDNKLLDFIRQHGSYLAPTASLDMMSFVMIIIRSMLMSLFVYMSALTVFMTGSLWLLYYITNDLLGAIVLNRDHPLILKGLLVIVGFAFLVIMLIKGFLYSLSTYSNKPKVRRLGYITFIKGQKSLGRLLKLSLTCLVFGSLPFIIGLIHEAYTFLVASGFSLFGAAVGLWQYKKAQNKEKNSGGTSNLLIYSGAFALFYGVLLFAYLISTNLFLDDQIKIKHPLLFLVYVLCTLLFGWRVNLNRLGPHYVWRSRLMEAFMPNKNAVETNSWQPATEANSALMENMCDKDNPRPYHIINTNVILANSTKVNYSGRGGDNFIISPLYCGSDATGWKTTKTFQNNKTRGITLATAMATSAAALNPNAAVSGEGVTRNIVVSILLSMLNLRLGYWTSNPARENKLSAPNFFAPGITSEILRFGLSETNKDILLSDGGHYENLALYELIRRKLNLIIVSDGGADPNFNFDDLANAIEKVRVDFGAKVSFKEGYKTDEFLPGTAGESAYQKKYEIAKRGFAIAEITYNDNTKGTLVYLKLAVIEDLPTDVFSYKGIYPSFPHQPTSDQFFDEKQFEAYRELGYYVTWQMMNSIEGKNIFQN